MKSKLLMVIVIGVVFLLAWQYLSKSSIDQNTESVKTGNQESPPPQTFALGQVKRVEENKIYFSVGAEEKVAVVTKDTRLIKQVQNKDGIGLSDAKLSDFKARVEIVVYFDEEPKANTYQATKVQIID